MSPVINFVESMWSSYLSSYILKKVVIGKAG
jgi:hypothetical protein